LDQKSARFEFVTTEPAASDQAKADVSALLTAALLQATNELHKRGPMYPFMITISAGGYQDSTPLARNDGTLTVGTEILAANLDALRAARSQFRAVAVVLDVPKENPPSESISIRCQHSEGLAIEADAPYTRSGLPKRVHVGALRVGPGERLIWPDTQP
jgi:hypothetical protein